MRGDGRNPHVFPGQADALAVDMTMAMLMTARRPATPSWLQNELQDVGGRCRAPPFEVAEAALAHTVGNAASQAYNRTTMRERRRPT